MKNRMMIMIACLLFAPTAWALSPVSTCPWSLNSNQTGNLVAHGEGYLRLGHTDNISIASDLMKLAISIVEEPTNIDSFSYKMEGTIFSPGVLDLFFNTSGTSDFGATFGDGLFFGTLHCTLPQHIPFYLVNNDNHVTVLQKNTRNTVWYNDMTKSDACIAGNLKSAVAQLKNQFWAFDPFKDLHATPEGLAWTEIYRTCLEWDDITEGGVECLDWEVTNNGPKVLPTCD